MKYIHLLIILLLVGGTLFLTSGDFVDKETSPKWYAYAFFSITLSFLVLVTNKNRLTVKTDGLTIAIVVFCLYLLIRILFSPLITIKAVYVACFLLLFVSFSYIRFYKKYINIIIVLCCLLQAVTGLLQYTHIIHFSGTFRMSGSFDNPAGFAVCLVCAVPFCFELINKKNNFRYLGLFSLFIISSAIVLSESRAGIISLVLITLFFLGNKYRSLLCRYKKILLSFLIVLVIISGTTLFYLKKDSALGRLLIWEVTGNMLLDNNLLFGSGNESFSSSYMLYQAEFFRDNPDHSLSDLADTVKHPFNEFLLFLSEYGLISLAFLAVIFFLVFRYSNCDNIYLQLLLAISLFGLFSYPLRYPFTWIMLAYSLSHLIKNVPTKNLINIRIGYMYKAFVTILMITGLYFTYKDMRFEYKWKKVATVALSGKLSGYMNDYDMLYHNWNKNPMFLYNYAAELNYNKRYHESLSVLNRCQLYMNDYEIQMLAADNYLHMGEYENARLHYQLASEMCPVRFMPLYFIFQIYNSEGDTGNAEKFAKMIISKKEKVLSENVVQIKREMEIFLKDKDL